MPAYTDKKLWIIDWSKTTVEDTEYKSCSAITQGWLYWVEKIKVNLNGECDSCKENTVWTWPKLEVENERDSLFLLSLLILVKFWTLRANLMKWVFVLWTLLQNKVFYYYKGGKKMLRKNIFNNSPWTLDQHLLDCKKYIYCSSKFCVYIFHFFIRLNLAKNIFSLISL